ncbi:MAG: hypothetical protein M1823_003394 [Watsoniomyces obsoletus]|nr:MAG: hypothetical protein M1823_003394 [Watsoniomyces obsoletus]
MSTSSPATAPSELGSVSNIRSVEANDYSGLVALARHLGIGLVVVGPDQAVVDGIEGYFRDSEFSLFFLESRYLADGHLLTSGGIPCFAPTKEAAEIEGSKAFAKELMRKYQIPTASYRSFDNYRAGQEYLDAVDARGIVIMADGLAAGKGVVLPTSRAEAHQALRDIMVDSKFGAAGHSVVVEECLKGDEISVLTFSDGVTFRSLPAGQDHKRIREGNQGPHTGGMGVYAPLPFVTPDDMREIEAVIIQPTLDGLKAEGRSFTEMLFTGIMMTAEGPKVLEYNARFGDPETQTLMMLLAPE